MFTTEIKSASFFDMSRLIQKKLVDLELREWVMPNFITTTWDDQVVASIVMMGAMKRYFRYACILECGVPLLTLLGQKEEYENVLHKFDKPDKLEGFGTEPS